MDCFHWTVNEILSKVNSDPTVHMVQHTVVARTILSHFPVLAFDIDRAVVISRQSKIFSCLLFSFKLLLFAVTIDAATVQRITSKLLTRPE